MIGQAHKVVAIEFVQVLHSHHAAGTPLAPRTGIFFHEGLVLRRFGHIDHREAGRWVWVQIVLTVDLQHADAGVVGTLLVQDGHGHLHVGRASVVGTTQRHPGLGRKGFFANGQLIVDVGDVGGTVIDKREGDGGLLVDEHVGAKFVGSLEVGRIGMNALAHQAQHHSRNTDGSQRGLAITLPLAIGAQGVDEEVRGIVGSYAHQRFLRRVGCAGGHSVDRQRVARIESFGRYDVRFIEGHFHPLGFWRELDRCDVGHDVLVFIKLKLRAQPSLVARSIGIGDNRNAHTND